MRPNRRTFVIVALAFVGGMLLLWAVRHLASTGFIEIVEAKYGVPDRTCTAGPDYQKVRERGVWRLPPSLPGVGE